MFISQETPAQAASRLQQVIARAAWQIHPGVYAFREYPLDVPFPVGDAAQALAFVRDAHAWSSLMPSTDAAQERFCVFSFHFADGLDNSGFVGWLASHLKAVLGTGVFVICGQNSARGGIFDYWGVPAELAGAAQVEIERLRAGG